MLQILFILAFSSSVQCKMDGFIVGGQQTSIRHWPFITFIEASMVGDDTYDDTSVIACGGTLLSSQTVLTAAHCLDDPTSSKKYMNIVRFNIYMGHSSFKKATVSRRVKDYETPSKYDPESEDVRCDIGVMFLENPVKFVTNVKKVILFNQRFKARRDRNVIVAGWGMTSPNEEDPSTLISPTLKEVRIKSITPEKCLRLCPFVDVKAVVCVEESHEFAYKGDSGGPLVKRGSHHQIGIVSFQHEDSGITIYTSVPAYYDWIKETQLKLYKKYCGGKG